MPARPRTVLFLCTGNYYRSRFAEMLFNALAAQAGIAWRATSAGLDVTRGSLYNVGPLSAHARRGLDERKVTVEEPLRMPRQTTGEEIALSDRVIALKEYEHRPMVERLFGALGARVTYWHVHDLDQAPPQEALREIENAVRELIAELTTP